MASWKKGVGKAVLVIVIVGGLFMMYTNWIMVKQTEPEFTDITTLKQEMKSTDKPYEGAVILGAGVRNNYPTPMLKERLDRGVELYKEGVVPILIMSGARKLPNDDEVTVMKAYAMQEGVPESAIVLDPKGDTTYASIMRMKHVYGYQRVLIVTQTYHMYRSLYLAQAAGLDAKGVSCTETIYVGQWKRDLREAPAKTKNWLLATFLPPFYSSEKE